MYSIYIQLRTGNGDKVAQNPTCSLAYGGIKETGIRGEKKAMETKIEMKQHIQRKITPKTEVQ
ncbi:hypothetical protein SERLADRAFT_394108 [Serpula lacrymans var. lacrymans S7.9]|uniref:Uncharacterized protein n=1 Tax=Serpula lacrymans var. lacrymans (strain S7.9) TaxID=578457 RepID=F8P1S4_SERL9|nr:uncharacterized protein SERLADRAFT_394108 [Serpula lacrymans var. lacrymans S7.9]EGO23103.1 hypothetical protein SERLADRAFT_394108 [Serpula lacrymans var. lacrymans S7.9]